MLNGKSIPQLTRTGSFDIRSVGFSDSGEMIESHERERVFLLLGTKFLSKLFSTENPREEWIPKCAIVSERSFDKCQRRIGNERDCETR